MLDPGSWGREYESNFAFLESYGRYQYTSQQSATRDKTHRYVGSFDFDIQLGRNGGHHKHQLLQKRSIHKIISKISEKDPLGPGQSGTIVFEIDIAMIADAIA